MARKLKIAKKKPVIRQVEEVEIDVEEEKPRIPDVVDVVAIATARFIIFFIGELVPVDDDKFIDFENLDQTSETIIAIQSLRNDIEEVHKFPVGRVVFISQNVEKLRVRKLAAKFGQGNYIIFGDPEYENP